MLADLTEYAENLLREIFEHRNDNGIVDSQYWIDKFAGFSFDEDTLCRSCFKELSDSELVKVMWADNCPYHMTVTSRGLAYYERLKDRDVQEQFKPSSLLATARDILNTEYQRPEGFNGYDYIKGPKYNRWLADLRVMLSKLPESCPLKSELSNEKYYTKHSAHSFQQVIGLLEALVDWEKGYVEVRPLKENKQYDVFLSHANADKLSYVDELYEALSLLGVNIFYDKISLAWGDNWKNKILNGTATSEFAIIVISKNFFDREWTERELSEFLTRQNEDGQKIVLPLLYDITPDDMKEKYPSLEEIQAISTDDFSKEQIALLFAKELIKRLKE